MTKIDCGKKYLNYRVQLYLAVQPTVALAPALNAGQIRAGELRIQAAWKSYDTAQKYGLKKC